MKVEHPFLFIIRNKDLPSGNDMIFIAKVESLKELLIRIKIYLWK